MTTTALSGRLNDGTNERTAAMAVSGGVRLFPPCIMDSHLCSFFGGPALLYLQLLLSRPHLLCLPSRLHSPSREVQVLPKERHDHYERRSTLLSLSTSRHCTPRFWPSFLSGPPFSPASSRSSGLSFSFSPPHPPCSTFQQLLVSPNNCHGDVDRLWTFSRCTLQMWLIKVEGGAGVRTLTRFCVRLLHLPDKLMSATSPQGGHKCIMALRRGWSWQAQGGLRYMVDINWDKVMNTINNFR